MARTTSSPSLRRRNIPFFDQEFQEPGVVRGCRRLLLSLPAHESVRQDPARSGKNVDQDQLVQDPGQHCLDLMRLRRPAQVYRIFKLLSDHTLCPSLLDGRWHCGGAAKRRQPQHCPPKETSTSWTISTSAPWSSQPRRK